MTSIRNDATTSPVKPPGRVSLRGILPLVLLVCVQVGLGLVRLEAVPRVYNDDAWLAALGYSLAFEGRLRHPIIEGWGGMHLYFVQNQVVQPLVLAVLYAVFGFSLWISRFASVVMGAVAAAAAYGLSRRWLSVGASLAVGLATVLHPWFFEISRRVRPDIYALAFALLALWFFLKPRSRWPMSTGVLAGATAGAALLSHPTGGVLCAALLAGFMLFDRPAAAGRRLTGLVLGAVLVASPYLVYVLWACGQPGVDFWAQMRGGKPLAVTGLGDILAGEWQRWSRFLQWPRGAPLALLMLLAWTVGLWRSSRADRAVCAAIAFFAAAMPFTTVNYTSRYLVGLVPWFAVLLARAADRLSGDSPPRRAAGWLIWGGYFTMCLAADAWMMHRLWEADVNRLFDRVAAEICTDAASPLARSEGRAETAAMPSSAARTTMVKAEVAGAGPLMGPGAVPCESRVYGEIMFWLAGSRFRYGPFPIEPDWRVPLERLLEYRFDYAIRGAWNFTASEGVSSPPATMPAWRPGYTLDTLCRDYGTLIAAFRDPYFGPIEIYRLAWPARR